MIDIVLIVRLIVYIGFIVIVIGALNVLWPTIIGAPWAPISMDVARKMLKVAKVTEADTVIDMGSGDGRIVMLAAEEFGAKGIGIEVDPMRVLWSRIAIRRRKLKKRVKIVWGNFFKTNIAEATVVTVYQGTDINKRLKEKLKSDLAPGTRVISYSFAFDGWPWAERIRKPNIYLYVI